jgi:perosamine synthetase
MQKLVTIQPPPYPIFPNTNINQIFEDLYTERKVDRYYFDGPTAFENELCEYLGVKHCFVTNSGHASVLITLMAAGVSAGDEVITTPISWAQTLSPILELGAIPVFADIEPDTFQISFENIVKLTTKKTKAVLVVNLYGSSPDLHSIKNFCSNQDITLIEDSAMSMGVLYGNKFTGTIADMGALSFNSNKLLAIGGAGAVISNDSTFFDKIIYHGSKATHKRKALVNKPYTIDGLDYTFLCHPILQEMGRDQLKVLSEYNSNRIENTNYLRNLLKDVKGIKLQQIHEQASTPIYMFSFVNEMPIKIELLLDLFKKVGLPAIRYNVPPLSRLPEGRFKTYSHSDCPNADYLSENEICFNSNKWYTKDKDYLDQYAEALIYCFEGLDKKFNA